MEAFANSDLFRHLNVEFALDEGLASEGDTIPVFYGERANWWLRLRSEGPTGHSSRFLSSQAATVKLHRCLDKFVDFRQQQAALFESGKPIAEVATINVTALKAGHSADGGQTFALNVVPSSAEVI
jgi:aminoacylase